jgi:hypothetical protein
LSVIFILILLLLIFRSLLAPLIPAFLAVAISGSLVAEAAHAGLKVSQLAQLMLIVLVLGAGTDCGLFLVFRIRENLREGPDPKDAVRPAALSRTGVQPSGPSRPDGEADPVAGAAGRGHRAGHGARRATNPLTGPARPPSPAPCRFHDRGQFGQIAPRSARDHEVALVCLGVDRGGQVAQGGRGVA